MVIEPGNPATCLVRRPQFSADCEEHHATFLGEAEDRERSLLIYRMVHQRLWVFLPPMPYSVFALSEEKIWRVRRNEKLQNSWLWLMRRGNPWNFSSVVYRPSIILFYHEHRRPAYGWMDACMELTAFVPLQAFTLFERHDLSESRRLSSDFCLMKGPRLTECFTLAQTSLAIPTWELFEWQQVKYWDMDKDKVGRNLSCNTYLLETTRALPKENVKKVILVDIRNTCRSYLAHF